MSLSTLAETAPLSSAEFATLDLDRIAEVGRRHKLLGDFLRQEGYSGLILQQPANIAWLTVGSRFRRGFNGGMRGAIFLTPEARVVVCSNVDTPQLFEHEVATLGFQLKERPWTEPRGVMLADLCRGRSVAADTLLPMSTDVSLHLAGMRLPLPKYDLGQLRQGGRLLAHAVEATCRAMTPGRTEQDIAGELAHRLLKHGVVPERLQILGDGHGRRFRHWESSDSTVQRWATIAAVGRYRELYVGAARTVAMDDPSEDLLNSYEKASLVTATGMFFSQPGWELFEVWNRVKRIYEKCGADDQWRLADQADVVDYEFGSVPLMPTSEFKLCPGVPVYWHPSVNSVLMGDTIAVAETGSELLTPATDWPIVPVSVKGTTVQVPGILVVKPTA